VTPAAPAVAERRRQLGDPAQRVIRLATDEDLVLRRRHHQREQEAYRIALMKVRERGLAMKLARVDQLYDGSRLVFYFTAEGRVDFRELVRELAAEFHSRIEMRRRRATAARMWRPQPAPAPKQLGLQNVRARLDQDGEAERLSLNPRSLRSPRRLKCCLRYEPPEGKPPRRTDVHDEVLENGNGAHRQRPVVDLDSAACC
jgi:cell fate regulator YaaT (PSP1 superfamily)